MVQVAIGKLGIAPWEASTAPCITHNQVIKHIANHKDKSVHTSMFLILMAHFVTATIKKEESTWYEGYPCISSLRIFWCTKF
mmetsp:Transcript_3532/g.7877  ORF Transcript_3532/g.7877 Transcript_3532/m.7877 type:complete len:82 (-) Transcript_3532:914-1159(-)